MIELENVSYHYPDFEETVFENLNLSLPAGTVSLIGQNGTGKSTLLLLAAGSALPTAGTVRIKGIDTADLRDEAKRQRYISLIFQNLEFETEEPIGDLLRFVYENGFHSEKTDDLVPELIKVFELDNSLNKKTQEVSKGELQRTILAFSLLYGSEILVMDEPIFALEPYQKIKAMEYITDYSREHGLTLYFSLHELDLSRTYSDFILLFSQNRSIELGPTEELFTRDRIEEAYQIPFAMLKDKEALYREMLMVRTARR